MGSLGDALATEAATRKVATPCTMGLLIDRLDDEDRAELATYLGDPAVTSTAISRALRKSGHALADCTVRRHRRGECACGG